MHMADSLVDEQFERIHVRTDRLFAVLMVVQWMAAMVAAFLISPRTWTGAQSAVHPHIWSAAFLGGSLAGLAVLLAITMPGKIVTRHAIAVCQMLMSALFIDISGGRIETHFHVFGSLAFLAFYRDWKVILTATVVLIADHLVRGVFWPLSVFGTAAVGIWRVAEHAGWVLFEDVFLIVATAQSVTEMRRIADRQARLAETENELTEAARRSGNGSRRSNI